MKILNAEIKEGKVYVDGVVVEDADKLCEGKTASKGYFIIDEDRYFYLTKTTQDLAAALGYLVDALGKITPNSLGIPSQGWSPAPTLPADLQTVIKDINDLKDKLT
ncbi:MAG: hypothetical protein LBU09_01010 [Endomicrobium sp.]|jgi:hypothetical protein|nr:hypothetical protein [Endomicrobium sp.]